MQAYNLFKIKVIWFSKSLIYLSVSLSVCVCVCVYSYFNVTVLLQNGLNSFISTKFSTQQYEVKNNCFENFVHLLKNKNLRNHTYL